jgi:chloride channel protein, CIC family
MSDLMPSSRWLLPAHRQEEARAIGRRTHQTVLFAAATGVVVGLVVLAIERITVDGLLDALADQPLWMQALAPTVGLLVAAACLRWVAGGASPATSDEYVAAFHDPGDDPVSLRPVFGRIVASIATIGYGGALGLEGPSIYAGSVIGSTAQRRFARFFSREDAKLLLVAGAAAGVAAIFKAPATGALFAIEVPYRGDVARRNVLPAMVASASSYVAFAAFDGTTPILPVDRVGSFGWAEIGGALVVGIVCGVGARLFSAAVRFLRGRSVAATPLMTRLALAGVTLAVLVWLSDVVLDAPLSLGPGYDVIQWATDPGNGFWLVVFLLIVRVVAVLATYGGGGAGWAMSSTWARPPCWWWSAWPPSSAPATARRSPGWSSWPRRRAARRSSCRRSWPPRRHSCCSATRRWRSASVPGGSVTSNGASSCRSLR